MLTAVNLIFNEGYAPTRGEPVVRADLCTEAIRLGRLLHDFGAANATRVAGLLA